MKKAIVTGSTGFIGKNLINELMQNNVEVIAVDRKGANWSNLPDEKITKVECDLSDISELPHIISDRDIDCLIHLAWAGVSGADRGDYNLQLKNAQYTCDMVKVASEMNIKRFAGAGTLAQLDGLNYIGKDGSTPNLVSCYGSAKTAAQFMSKALANSLKIEHIWCYISNIYGIGDTSNNFINFACKKLLNGERASFTAGEQNYDFVYVTDTIKGLYLCAQNGKPNHSYYIGSGHARKLKEYISIIRDDIDRNIPLYLGEVPFNGISLPIEAFSCERITTDTGYMPMVDFETGIQKTIQWLKEK